MVSVTEVVYTISSTTSISTSTVYSTELPRAGCDLNNTASATTATGTAECSAGNRPAPTREIVGTEQDDAVPVYETALTSRAVSKPAKEATVDLNKDTQQTASVDNTTAKVQRRNGCEIDSYMSLVIPKDPFDVKILHELISGYKYKDSEGNEASIPWTKVWAPSHQGFTGGWFLEHSTDELNKMLKEGPYSEKVCSETVAATMFNAVC